MGEGEGGMFRENSIETRILSRVKQTTSQGWMHETSARTWCTGKSQRDQVEREVGGGIGLGNTCKSMADSCWCVTKATAMLWSDWPPTNKNKEKIRIIQHSCHKIFYSPNSSFTLSLFSQLQFDVSVPKIPHECSTQKPTKAEIIYLFKGHLVLLV